LIKAKVGIFWVRSFGEHRVAELADRDHLIAALQFGKARQIGAHAEDVGLAGDRDERGIGGDGLVDRGAQRRQPQGPERVRLGVVHAVVQRDERGLLRHARHADEAQLRVGYQLTHAVATFQFGFSQITLPPIPIPTHMAVRP
jgi:hypothetical protein